MDSVLTLKDLLKYQDLLAKQFSEIGRLSLLSNTETWELFLAQEESDIIPRDHLPAVKAILFGSPTLSIEVFRDVATGVLKKHKYCTIIRVPEALRLLHSLHRYRTLLAYDFDLYI